MEAQRDSEFANGWMVVVSAFFIGFFTDGLAFSFGVLLIELTDEFRDSIAVITFVGSLTNSVMHLTGPIAGLLSGIASNRAIVIFGAVTSFSGFLGATFSKSLAALSMTYGLLTGIGFCLMFLPVNANVLQHFEKKRALAAGIAACGSGVGTFISSLLFRYLIDHYTWRGATFGRAAKPAYDAYLRSNLDRKKNNLAQSVPSILLPDEAVNIGMTKLQATWLVSSIGMASVFGRGFCGLIADYKFANKMVMFESTLILAGFSTAMSSFLESFETKMLYSCLFGFLIGGYIVLVPVLLADMFGPDLIMKSYGLTMLSIGIPCLFAAPFGGWLFEVTGSFRVTYVVAGLELILGGLTLLLPVCCKRFSTNKVVSVSLKPV